VYKRSEILEMDLPRIQPINSSRIAAAFDHPDWIFEYDGFCEGTSW